MIEALALVVVLTTPPTTAERPLVEVALHRCPAAGRPDPLLLLGLLRLEEFAGVPDSMRGILLAAACGESRFTADGRRGDEGRARGMLQQHSWTETWCGHDRGSPVEAAHCWLGLVVRQLPKVERLCSWRTVDRSWVAAEVRSVRYPRADTHRCREVSNHVKMLRRWQRLM